MLGLERLHPGGLELFWGLKRIFVTAPSAEPQIKKWAEEGLLVYLDAPYDVSMLAGKYLVLACTDDEILNHQVVLACRQRKIMVNNCSNHEECDFYFPSVIRQDEIVIGISGDGKKSCGKVKDTRKRLESML